MRGGDQEERKDFARVGIFMKYGTKGDLYS